MELGVSVMTILCLFWFNFVCVCVQYASVYIIMVVATVFAIMKVILNGFLQRISLKLEYKTYFTLSSTALIFLKASYIHLKIDFLCE